MVAILIALILLGALFVLAAAIRAIQSWLRFRRARATFRSEVTEEVARLARRAGELESNLSKLDARAQQLPIHISELQQSLATLTILTGALSTTLRQAQRVLSYSALKTLSSASIAGLLKTRFTSGKSVPPG